MPAQSTDEDRRTGIAAILATAGALLRDHGAAAADAHLDREIAARAETPDLLRDLAIALPHSDVAECGAVHRLLVALVRKDSNDPDVLRSYVLASWLRAQHDPADTRALEAARHLVRIAPDDHDAYRLLGCTALSCGSHQEAFLAFSSAAALAGRDLFGMTRQLARLLMQGYKVACFDLDGVPYTFEFATFSTQAIEASSFHAAARMTEIEELRFVRDFVGPCDTVVEVGALVGNHTVFFMKNLRPRRIMVFEANPRAAEQIRRNADLNQDPERPTRVDVIHTFVSAGEGPDHGFAGGSVGSAPLDRLVEGTVDFIKIDVDGAEIDVLNGARELLARARPKVMVEVNALTEAGVRALMAELRYAVVHEIAHPGYKNLFLRAVD